MGGSTAFIEALLEEAVGKSSLSAADRALCKELVLGCVRWKDMLDMLVANQLVRNKEKAAAAAPPITDQVTAERGAGAGGGGGARRPQKQRQQTPQTRCLLRMGLYQIVVLDKIPPHAAVSETVALARRCGQAQQAGFMNAVLRAYADDQEGTRRAVEEMRNTLPAAGFSHPQWLVDSWQKRYGTEEACRLMQWNNEPAPTYARINRLLPESSRVLEMWKEEGVAAQAVDLEWAKSGEVYLVKLPQAAERLPSFQQGLYYMQDPSTLLAVHVLDPQEGDFIVDLCAAPGGKACMIAERIRNVGTVVASDIDVSRLRKVEDNCARLGVTCVTTAAADELTRLLPAAHKSHKCVKARGGEEDGGGKDGGGAEGDGGGAEGDSRDSPHTVLDGGGGGGAQGEAGGQDGETGRGGEDCVEYRGQDSSDSPKYHSSDALEYLHREEREPPSLAVVERRVGDGGLVGVGGPGGEQHVASASRGVGDGLVCEEEWEGLADRVLVDAPCSNSGVMRRRVDLRWRIEKEEVRKLHEVQFALLQRAATLVCRGGVLVYSTCSIEPDENDNVVRRFLAYWDKHVPGKWALEYSRQVSPLTDAIDGAFVAKLRRNMSGSS